MFEDDDSPSPSSAEYLESPHEAKRKALLQKIEKKGIKDAATKPAADLKQLKLTLLRGQMEPKNDPSKAPKDEKAVGKMATKTREQEIVSEKLTADTKPTAEQLVKQGTQDQKAEDALKTDEVQSEDA